ncbi:MAG: type II toxin-antitoxin system PemK/MazF family toxin [Ignavibacteriaceae bacterium]
MPNNNPDDIKRGDIWLVNFDPTVGAEIRKTRPAVVISSDGLAKLPVKIVVPLTAWRDDFKNSFCHVKIKADRKNHLQKDSAADALQVKSVAVDRFVSPRIGWIESDLLEEIVLAVGAAIELG